VFRLVFWTKNKSNNFCVIGTHADGLSGLLAFEVYNQTEGRREVTQAIHSTTTYFAYCTVC
jgi:hypothetical protein